MDKKAVIAAVETAVPPYNISQKEVWEFFSTSYSSLISKRYMEIFEKILSHDGIKNRYIALEKGELFKIIEERHDDKIERYKEWTVRLAKEAICKALEKSNTSLDDVTDLIFNSCTGYVCPGISTYILEELNASPTIKYYDLIGSGCGGAIPNLELGRTIVEQDPSRVVLSISAEICTVPFQMGEDLSLIVSNAIFGDGCSAVLIKGNDHGYHLKKSYSLLVPEYRHDVEFVYKNGYLHNQVSQRLPKLVGKKASELVKSVLHDQNITKETIDGWAFHTGGAKLLDSVQKGIGLTNEDMNPSNEILSHYGNMSSPSVIFVLKKLLEEKEMERCLITAYGAGASFNSFYIEKE